jgi:hypothetical protein
MMKILHEMKITGLHLECSWGLGRLEFKIKGSDRFDGSAVDGDGTMKAGKEITR